MTLATSFTQDICQLEMELNLGGKNCYSPSDSVRWIKITVRLSYCCVYKLCRLINESSYLFKKLIVFQNEHSPDKSRLLNVNGAR